MHITLCDVISQEMTSHFCGDDVTQSYVQLLEFEKMRAFLERDASKNAVATPMTSHCAVAYWLLMTSHCLGDDVTQLTTANSKNKACLSEIPPKTRLPRRQVKEQAVRKYVYIYNIYSPACSALQHVQKRNVTYVPKQGSNNV